jgi:hypothetical protein
MSVASPEIKLAGKSNYFVGLGCAVTVPANGGST